MARDVFLNGAFLRTEVIWKRLVYVPALMLVFLAVEPSTQGSEDTGSRNAAAQGEETLSKTRRLVLLMERALSTQINKERAKQGLVPLVPSQIMSSVARKHSRNMCLARELKHESDKFPEGWGTFEERMRKIRLSSGAENVAYRTVTGDPTEWAQRIVTGWLRSPEHRRNILDPSYRYIGTGVFVCRNGIAFATQVFSQKSSSPK